MHKKIYLGGMAFAVPPKYIIEPLNTVYIGRDHALLFLFTMSALYFSYHVLIYIQNNTGENYIT